MNEQEARTIFEDYGFQVHKVRHTKAGDWIFVLVKRGKVFFRLITPDTKASIIKYFIAPYGKGPASVDDTLLDALEEYA